MSITLQIVGDRIRNDAEPSTAIVFLMILLALVLYGILRQKISNKKVDKSGEPGAE